MKKRISALVLVLLFGAAALMMGCGGTGASQQPPPSTVSLTISPATVTVFGGETQAFAANVSGTNDTVVTWSVQEPGGGTITGDGIYTAPRTAGTFHVVATSRSDSSKTAVATVSVPPVIVTITPASAAVFFGATQTFAAVVTGSHNTDVSWGVQEVGGGGITSLGLYTAPFTAGTFHVTATSQADSSKSATAPVTVSDPQFAFTIDPMTDTLGPGGERAFAASVPVAWSIQEGTAGGTVNQSGVYVAPQVPGTYHVVATSSVAPTVTQVATVTVVNSGFTRTGNMLTPRYSHTVTLLANGRVLIVGGSSTFQVFGLNSAELYDPATGLFSATGSMSVGRLGHTATLLSSGKVLVAGGDDGRGTDLSSAEIYDPDTGSFSPTGELNTRRTSHTATLLEDGQVVIAGGETEDPSAPLGRASLDTAELYDPQTGAFQLTGRMNSDRVFYSANRLMNGKVLIAGGHSLLSEEQRGAELYDPATRNFTSLGNLVTNRSSHSATLLSDGRVLVVGGWNSSDLPEATSEIFDPNTGSFGSVAQFAVAGLFPPVALLPDGSVLLSGGSLLVDDAAGQHFVSVFTAGIFNPATGVIKVTGSLADARGASVVTRLQDGRVLVTGGIGRSGEILASAELYH